MAHKNPPPPPDDDDDDNDDLIFVFASPPPVFLTVHYDIDEVMARQRLGMRFIIFNL